MVGDGQRSRTSTVTAALRWALRLLLCRSAAVSYSASLLAVLLLLAASGPAAVISAPIDVPDLQQCQLAFDTSVVGPLTTISLNCCLPIPANAINFSFSAYPVTQQLVRQPAHTVSEDYIAKYTHAYELMRSLPADDPRSLQTQADLHCAFCNGAYRQTDDSTSPTIQVHFSWVFLPWHRWYLYFHERILQSLLGDPSFSLVFWHWDDQQDGGNVMPDMFVRNGTALYDAKRNQNNLPPTLVKLSATTTSNDSSVIIDANLNDMYQGVVTASSAELFMGGAYRLGANLTNSSVLGAPLGGSLENGVHNAVHFWTGDPNQPLIQDMGTFTTASRDPIFFAHHSNVDRLWEVWRSGLPSGPRADHTDPDFLDAAFYFYDENANLVRVTVRDALDNSKFGISYPAMATDALWINYSPTNATINGSALIDAINSGLPIIGSVLLNDTAAEIYVGSQLAAIVARPSGTKPGGTQEVLVIQGLEMKRESFVALVVFVNAPAADASTDTSTAQYLGTFNIIPTASAQKNLLTNVKFEIGDNLQRLGLQNEEAVVITLAVQGAQVLTIQGLVIEYE